VLFKPTPRHSLRLGYSRAYRPPTIIENYVKVDTGFSIDLGPLGPFVVRNLAVGNRELDVVRSDGFELGYTGVLRGAHTFSATVYNIRIRDGIYGGIAEFYGPEDPPPGWPLPSAFVPPFALPKLLTFRNVGTIRNRGFESSLNSGWGTSFWTVLAYTWQDRPRLGDTNPLFPVTLNLPSRHQASATVGGTHGRWKGSAGITYTSRAFWADVFDPRFWGYTGSYLLANASIEHAFPVWRLEGVLRATDLFDRKVQQHAFGDIIRRRATLEIRKRF
jgi:outer membrane receptor protein involved in Fe transport